MALDGWRSVEFGDIASLEYGKSLPAAHRRSGGIAVCGSSGVVGRHDESLVRGPGIVVGRKGSVGTVIWMDGDFWPIDTTYYVNVRGETDVRWLYYATSRLQFDRLNQATGVPGLNRNTAAALKLDVPPISEQRGIAAVLSSVDHVADRIQAVIDQVHVVKRGLMQELLTQGLPGRHTRFKQTEIGKMPEDWGVISLAGCGARITSGSRGWAKYYSKTGALFLRITNLARNTIRLQLRDTRHVALPEATAESRRTRVQAGDILVSITADLGMVSVIPENMGEAYVNQHLALVRLPDCELSPEFAAYFLTTVASQNRFNRLNDSGAKAGLNLSTIGKLTVPVPSRDEQDAIVRVLAATEDRLAVEMRKLAELAVAKRALMSVLLTGEVRVAADADVGVEDRSMCIDRKRHARQSP